MPVLVVPASQRKLSHGTSVAGVAMGATESQGEFFESGTSLAAPLVSRLCWYVISFVSWLYAIDNLVESIRQSGAIDLTQAMQLSQAEPLPEFLQQIKKQELQYQLSASPSHVKRMIEAMAQPMQGYAAYQVGAGFVDETVTEDYLVNFSPRDFLQLFQSDAVDEALIKRFEQKFPALLPAEFVRTQIITPLRQQLKAVDYPIL